MQAFYGLSLRLLGFRTATSIQILELFSTHPGMIGKRFPSIFKSCTKIFGGVWCSIILPQLCVREIHVGYKIPFPDTPLSKKIGLTQKERVHFRNKLEIFIRRDASDVISL
jgi:polyferredoxin